MSNTRGSLVGKESVGRRSSGICIDEKRSSTWNKGLLVNKL